VESHIRTVYAEEYGARLFAFPTTLAADIGPDGRILSAAGVRFAAGGFFSEIYLDAPVEVVLTAIEGFPVERERILEVTTLASRRVGTSLKLIDWITDFGRHRGYQWGFFNATARLYQVLTRIGMPVVPLAPGDPARVPNPEDWGTYLNTNPWVLALRDDPTMPLDFSQRPTRSTPAAQDLEVAHG
jgi:hypothetical protein